MLENHPCLLCGLDFANKRLLLSGLEITAGQRTMSGQIGDLTGQTFHLPVILTVHIQLY